MISLPFLSERFPSMNQSFFLETPTPESVKIIVLALHVWASLERGMEMDSDSWNSAVIMSYASQHLLQHQAPAQGILEIPHWNQFDLVLKRCRDLSIVTLAAFKPQTVIPTTSL